MMAVAETLTLARLVDFLAHDYPRLRLYMGETAFNTMARHCLAATEAPKHWLLSRHLPDFLDLTKPFSRSPELSDLARLEKAFHAAHNAPEASVITRALPHAFHIELHPSVQRLQLRTNATSIWAALTAGELPPLPQRLDEPQELLVWRQGAAPRFRMLGREEAATLDGAARGEKIEISQSAENFLRGWLEAEIISDVRDLNDVGEK
ncbi:MAG: hypothetical protein Q7T14_07990 [Aestuariivirga sp.]|nr:hypothetical protein [Aestuariivirga sp.]